MLWAAIAKKRFCAISTSINDPEKRTLFVDPETTNINMDKNHRSGFVLRTKQYQYGQNQQEWICFVHFSCSGNLWHIIPPINVIEVLDLEMKWYMFGTFFLLVKHSSGNFLGRSRKQQARVCVAYLSHQCVTSRNILRRNCTHWQLGWSVCGPHQYDTISGLAFQIFWRTDTDLTHCYT